MWYNQQYTNTCVRASLSILLFLIYRRIFILLDSPVFLYLTAIFPVSASRREVYTWCWKPLPKPQNVPLCGYDWSICIFNKAIICTTPQTYALVYTSPNIPIFFLSHIIVVSWSYVFCQIRPRRSRSRFYASLPGQVVPRAVSCPQQAFKLTFLVLNDIEYMLDRCVDKQSRLHLYWISKRILIHQQSQITCILCHFFFFWYP